MGSCARPRAGSTRPSPGPPPATVGADTLDSALRALFVGVEDTDSPPLGIPIVTELRLPERAEARAGSVVVLVAGTVAGADVRPVVALEATDVRLLAVGEQHGPLVPRAALDERVVGVGALLARRRLGLGVEVEQGHADHPESGQ